MEKKKVLSKVLPAVLVFILVVLFVVVISSCTKSKKTPTGEIVDEKDYIKVQLGDDTYSVSKLDFYNRLRYVGYQAFEDELTATVLKTKVNEIKADIEANKADLTASKYYDKFVYIIDKAVYQKTDKKEIEKFEEKDRIRNIKTYLNTIETLGFKTDGTDNIYQLASLEYQINNLAKREYARDILAKEVDEVDGDHEITDKEIEDYFTENASAKGDIKALVVFFSSENEVNEALMQLNLKFVGNKVYRVLPTLDNNNDGIMDADEDENGTIEYSEYETFYKDFDCTKDGITALSDNEYLFELCRVYNYIYGSYKTKLQMTIEGVDYLGLHTANPLVEGYTKEESKKITALKIEDMITQLASQDLGDYPTSPRITYTYDALYDLDSTLAAALETKYLYIDSEKPKYNNPKSTYAKGNYLAFKLEDSYTASYRVIKSLVNLKDACATDSTASEKTITAYIQEIKEEYRTLLLDLGIYSDDAKVKEWALKLADEIKLLDVTGAKNILDCCAKESTNDKFWKEIFEETLNDEFITKVIADHIKDDCKISIYDQLFEVQYAEKNEDYKKVSKANKNLVAEVKVYDEDGKLIETNQLTVADMYDRLEKTYGASESLALISNQLLKEKYYSQITDKKKKEFEKEYNQVLSYFAQGNTTNYGYSPNIGLQAFTQLYFKADNKEDAIFNMWVAAELKRIALFEDPKAILPTVYENLKKLTDEAYDEFAAFDYRAFIVYTDDDEDGEADDWRNIDTTNPTLVARKAEVEELSMKLINVINSRLKNEYTKTNQDTAYNSLLSKYNSSSRISQKGDFSNGDAYPAGALTSAEIDAYYFAGFKAKGIYVTQDTINLTELKDMLAYEDEVQEQLQSIYKWIMHNETDYKNSYTFAVKVNLNDDYQHQGGSLDEITDVSQLFLYKKGYATYHIVTSTEQKKFTFEVKDNADDDVTGKVYPYSINEDDPFPADENGKPLDNSSEADTLYNLKDVNQGHVTVNQLIVYIKEYEDGVESLALNVVESFGKYFEEKILKAYMSPEFLTYLSYELLMNATASNSVTISSDLAQSIETYATNTFNGIFGFEESKLATLWFSLFTI